MRGSVFKIRDLVLLFKTSKRKERNGTIIEILINNRGYSNNV